jgi:mRNA interferase RelE/StbE
VTQILISPRADHDINKLSRDVADRIAEAIEKLSQNPRPPGCLLLKNYKPQTWRIRIGDWRVLYEIHDQKNVVIIRNVHHRSHAY